MAGTARVLVKIGDKVVTVARRIADGTKVETIQSDDGVRTPISEGTIKIESGPPTPPVNQPLKVSAGDDVTIKEGQQVILDGSVTDSDNAIIRADWTQSSGQQVQLVVDPNDNTNVSFTAPILTGTDPAEVLLFNLEAENDAGDIKHDQVIVTVTKDGTQPPPAPPPPPGNVLWDSNIDGHWNNGVKRTVTNSEGSIQPNGKGVQCRASGNPKLVIDGDGIAHLVSGSGEAEDLSLKLRSRHNEGGVCEDRFGGFGCSIDRSSIGMKTESCHNNHENSASKSAISIKNGEWHKIRFECKDSDIGNSVDFDCAIDGVSKMKHSHKNPAAAYIDKAKFAKNSYLWIRTNNSDHGRIYIYATNYDAALDLEWMFEGGNSIALRNVTLTTL